MTSATDILQSTFGFDAFRPPQDAIVETLSTGGDALVLMPTGGGKSLCYQIPALLQTRVRRRDFTADRPDAGPGQRPARSWACRPVSSTPRWTPRRPGEVEAALLARRTRPALCRPRKTDPGAHPGPAGAGPAGAVRHRRGPLRVAVGPRLSRRLPAAGAACTALSRLFRASP